jgi:phosphopantothenoylcysteine decarboxylase / phosphopantothenate---cysteine ligase
MNVLLGVTGGIAAYKAVEVVRRLREQGCAVRVVMTEAAQAFVGPLTFQAVSGYPVRTQLDDSAAEAAMGHIELARWADLLLIAPATADCLAKLAHGLADDLLSTLALATTAKVAVAPAMNAVMWAHPATVENVATLARRGVQVWGPAAGEQACGEVGVGRLIEPTEIVSQVLKGETLPRLRGKRMMITAGPTREPLDPVRFLTNRSSGKMGYALAHAAQQAGATVVLVSGPVNQPLPVGVVPRAVTTAQEMYQAVMADVAGCDIFIGAAAVADYRPVSQAAQKIKKTNAAMTLTLEPTQDIIAAVANVHPRPFVVGFAAETECHAEHARAKRVRKGMDMIIANAVERADTGFDSDDNELHVISARGERYFAKATKSFLAQELIQLIADEIHA